MKQKIFEAVLDKSGKIMIPNDVLKQMGMKSGDSLEISYPYPTEEIERCLRIEGYYAEDDTFGDSLCIPNEIMSECGLCDKPIHMLCMDGEIIITSSEKVCSVVPKTILKVFEKYGITTEQIALGIAEIKSENKSERG